VRGGVGVGSGDYEDWAPGTCVPGGLVCGGLGRRPPHPPRVPAAPAVVLSEAGGCRRRARPGREAGGRRRDLPFRRKPEKGGCPLYTPEGTALRGRRSRAELPLPFAYRHEALTGGWLVWEDRGIASAASYRSNEDDGLRDWSMMPAGGVAGVLLWPGRRGQGLKGGICLRRSTWPSR